MSSIDDRIARLSPEKRELLLRRMAQEKTNAVPRGVPHVPRDAEAYPLSVAQERMWFLQQLDPAGTAYSLHFAIRLQGGLDVTLLERSLQEVVQRHEALRTSFISVDGVPAQRIVPARTLRVSRFDLTDVAAGDQPAATDRIIREQVNQPFDLTRDLLLRAILLRLRAAEYILLLAAHHIVFDGWSGGVLARELTEIYAAYQAGRPLSLAPLPYQYIDYAQWQRTYLQSEAPSQTLTYWKEKLGGELPPQDLPVDYAAVEGGQRRGGVFEYNVPRRLLESLRTLGREEQSTLYMTLLAGFYVLLYRLTGQNDLLVGSPVAGRQQTGSDKLIGCFINTLLLRVDLDEDVAFRAFLRRVRGVALEANANQEVPIEHILLELQRRHHAAPPFRVLFNMFTWTGSQLELPGITAELLPLDEIRPKFDITLYVREQPENLWFRMVYDAALFKRERIEELVRQYVCLLEEIAADPEKQVGNYSLVTSGSSSLLPDPRAPIEEASYGSVQERFAEVARKNPHRTAIVERGGRRYSYGTLEERANQLARYLEAHGVGPGEVVGIYAYRSASLVWAILGVLKAGAAFTVLDPAYPAARLASQMESASMKALLQLEETGALPEELEIFVQALPLQCRLLMPSLAEECGALDGYSNEEVRRTVDPKRWAYVAFTSGSTGQPKGIVGTHGPLSHFMHWHSTTFHFEVDDRFSLLSGLSHDPLLRDIFTPFWTGATLCIPDGEEFTSPEAVAAWMLRERVTIAHLTPAMLQFLAQAGYDGQRQTNGLKLEALRYAFFGGDVLVQRHVSLLQGLAPAAVCVNFYGATETPQAVGYYVVPEARATAGPPPVRAPGEAVPLGQGIDGVQLLVLNRAGQQAGIGELGEICVRTPYLSEGYLGDETLTKERFRVNHFTGATGDLFYRTGDLGRYLPDANVGFAGRADKQVKIRGFRIEPGEIETVLLQHAAVLGAVVVAREDKTGEKRLVAYVVSGGAQTVSELRAYLLRHLPDYMIPAAFVFMEALPLTPNGKVDRKGLPEPDQSRPELRETFVPPRTDQERVLAEICGDVLSLERVGVYDNLFDLGANSFLVFQIHSRAQKAGLNLVLQDFFGRQTVAELAVLSSERTTREAVAARLREKVQNMSPEEVRRLLQEKKARLGRS